METVAESKNDIRKAATVLIESGVMSISLHGNISARVDEGFLLTAGGSLDNLRDDNIALFSMDAR